MHKHILCLLLTIMLLPVPGAFTQDADTCRVQPIWDTMPIFAIPLEAYGMEIAYVPNGTEYEVLMIRDMLGGLEDGYEMPMYLIQVDADTTGWTAYFTASLIGDCDDIPRDTSPRDAYEGICYALNADGNTIAVLTSRVNGIEPYCGHAMARVAPLDEIEIVEPCETLPFRPAVISTTVSTRLHRDPSEQSEVLAALDAAVSVLAIEASSQTSAANRWFRVLTQDGMDGWIPAANTEPSAVGWEAIGTGTLAARTNLWTTPDVTRGRVFTSVSEATGVNVLYGPVTGPIRRESELTGAWYFVSIETHEFMRWWVWEGNLTIDDNALAAQLHEVSLKA
jgi:hypothetical protein